MTYNVFGWMLNLAQSQSFSCRLNGLQLMSFRWCVVGFVWPVAGWSGWFVLACEGRRTIMAEQ